MAFEAPESESSLASVPLNWSPDPGEPSHLIDLQCRIIIACDHFGSFTVLAGRNLVILDIAAKTVLRNVSAKSAFWFIRSAQFCRVPGRLLLALGGEYPDYSGSNTDLLRLTTKQNKASLQLGRSSEVWRLESGSDCNAK